MFAPQRKRDTLLQGLKRHEIAETDALFDQRLRDPRLDAGEHHLGGAASTRCLSVGQKRAIMASLNGINRRYSFTFPRGRRMAHGTLDHLG
ncbi:hypothetical protein ACSRUE_34665 [Sorangium sp. KYC3313]|uniref:hypothetical protein n=1 Tax=Sorangium sp. KYC3313 TaxID=3449740 RepID=UPI003F8B8C3C